ncbi:SDR family NAD(P)-dependent oxidoreductase [Bacillus pseudomycoides]|uniref:SDR family NAD(P)-dependent oxidoreductase n=1 Tax=Bacillus pseudomycoides TaxID=64104 RepID=UPI001FB519A9|nr:SDR family NAD(P)-dependent oxidoreductase [Bacillus pseudomycoides]
MVKEDANVVVCSRHIEAYEKVVKEIRVLGKRALVLALDVTDPESVVQGMDKAISHFSTG